MPGEILSRRGLKSFFLENVELKIAGTHLSQIVIFPEQYMTTVRCYANHANLYNESGVNVSDTKNEFR